MFADTRLKIILALAVVVIGGVVSLDPIAQNPAYHSFADRRTILDVPNLFNVLSNLPFVIVGTIGLIRVALGRTDCGSAELKGAHTAFFAGVLLTGFGSAYYHYHPDNATLLWDRLPMTVALTAFFIVVVGEYLSLRLARKMLAPLLLLGIASAVYWHITELHGNGDLRPYALVQFLPLVLIPLILWFYDSEFNKDRYYWGVIGSYAAAKLAEFFDVGIYRHLELFSGHTLKHLLAALGTFIFYCALSKRKGQRKV